MGAAAAQNLDGEWGGEWGYETGAQIKDGKVNSAHICEKSMSKSYQEINFQNNVNSELPQL